jgi:hypothetical protein
LFSSFQPSALSLSVKAERKLKVGANEVVGANFVASHPAVMGVPVRAVGVVLVKRLREKRESAEKQD